MKDGVGHEPQSVVRDTNKSHWDEDVLQRREYADFLTKFLVAKAAAGPGQETRSYTLALDAEWGEGKTFFVSRWAMDLKQASPPHPTLVFDAWQSDYAADPVVAFMAAFKRALDELVGRAKLGTKLKAQAQEKIDAAVAGFRKAILPATKAVAKGVLKKATGVAYDDLASAFTDGTGLDLGADLQQLEKGGLQELNKGLDLFFAKALEEQNERGKVISAFRESISKALGILVEHGDVQLPMFVFIDELDRCRPSFAITMLEGVKHLFGVPGVCFVISTNLKQLSESVKAVYGPAFDGFGYLQRFFEAEYSLPAADTDSFVGALVAEHACFARDDLYLGLPLNGFIGEPKKKLSAADTFAWVFSAFELDLRSQRKVMEMTQAAMTGITGKGKIHLLWLAVLCAIRHKDPSTFSEMETRSGEVDIAQFRKAWALIAPRDSGRRIRTGHPGFQTEDRTVYLIDVAGLYYSNGADDLKDIASRFSGQHLYPESVMNVLAEEISGGIYYTDRSYPPSIAKYYRLVRHAGHFTQGS